MHLTLRRTGAVAAVLAASVFLTACGGAGSAEPGESASDEGWLTAGKFTHG